MTQEQLLTLPQVCDLMQLGPDHVRRAVRRGDLPASKLGGRLRFRPSDVDTYIDGRRVTPTTPAPPYDPGVRAPSKVPPRSPAPTSFRERARRAQRAA